MSASRSLGEVGGYVVNERVEWMCYANHGLLEFLCV